MTNSDAILLLHRAEEAEEKAAAAEDALRGIAYFLGCGAYNDVGLVPFDPAVYAKKIKETITHDQRILLEKSHFPKTNKLSI